MLTDSEIMVILPVRDMARAKEFYKTKLELVPEGERSDGSFVFKCGHVKLSLMPKPGGTKADHTALTIAVDNIKEEIASLKSRGVKFEDYSLPKLKTVDHIATMANEKAAWFTDTEGNILCIHEDLKRSDFVQQV